MTLKPAILCVITACLFLVPGPPCSASAGAEEQTGFSMQIMDAFKITGRGVVMTGQVESGVIAIGDAVCVPLRSGGKAARAVEGIEQFRKVLESAGPGDSVGVLVADIDVKDVETGARLDTGCDGDPGSHPDRDTDRDPGRD